MWHQASINQAFLCLLCCSKPSGKDAGTLLYWLDWSPTSLAPGMVILGSYAAFPGQPILLVQCFSKEITLLRTLCLQWTSNDERRKQNGTTAEQALVSMIKKSSGYTFQTYRTSRTPHGSVMQANMWPITVREKSQMFCPSKASCLDTSGLCTTASYRNKEEEINPFVLKWASKCSFFSVKLHRHSQIVLTDTHTSFYRASHSIRLHSHTGRRAGFHSASLFCLFVKLISKAAHLLVKIFLNVPDRWHLWKAHLSRDWNAECSRGHFCHFC